MATTTLYLPEITAMGDTTNPAKIQAQFDKLSARGLTKSNGFLQIDLKCDAPANIGNNELRISSCTTSDVNDWKIINTDVTNLGITNSYQTFNIPLSGWTTTSTELNVNSIIRVEWNALSTSGNINIYFKNIYLIYPRTHLTYVNELRAGTGFLPTSDDNMINESTFTSFQTIMKNSIRSGSFSVDPIVSTYSLVYTTTYSYYGGVLNQNGDIIFISYTSTIGQKISPSGVVSTFSLLTISNLGGVLSPNGDIYMAPHNANRGQKISNSGVVSTYSLLYTAATAYWGCVLAPNGDTHFIPASANRGQKVSSSGTVSTYSLVYTTSYAYSGGVLSPNGDIHFVPREASVGQKISPSGIVSTYSLLYTTTTAYEGGVLASNGDIHFAPGNANRGQKIDINGTVSTYSLVYTTSAAYSGGVLSPNGDIYFVPGSASVGQKISIDGVVSTYSLSYTTTLAYFGGTLDPNGDIHFIPRFAAVGQKISTGSAKPFPLGVCCHSFFNKM